MNGRNAIGAEESSPATGGPELASGERMIFGDLVSRSPNVKRMFKTLENIAPSDLSLLIVGETGAGKEVVAESVHRASYRRDGPFVVFDCAEKSPVIAARELFGQSAGESSADLHAMSGILEQADRGTLVFDHIDCLSIQLQAGLLRALKRGHVQRVGGTEPIAFDSRIISLTCEDLSRYVSRGAFRADLYRHISQCIVQVPPLRRRITDLPLLAQSLFARYKPVRSVEEIPSHLWMQFRKHRWPGNVREFNNALQRALITAKRPP
jgi:DNA-binding NtrC family response regulator